MMNGEDISAARKERGKLATAQQRRAANPLKSVWVEASAGTGKTKVLSDRVLRLLLSGVAPSKILCLTYTKADNVYVPSEFYLYNPYSLQGDVSVYAPFDGDYAFTPYGENLGYNPEYTCQTSFLVQNNVITGWKWVGNDCVAR